jgi:hypothetical protein
VVCVWVLSDELRKTVGGALESESESSESSKSVLSGGVAREDKEKV